MPWFGSKKCSSCGHKLEKYRRRDGTFVDICQNGNCSQYHAGVEPRLN